MKKQEETLEKKEKQNTKRMNKKKMTFMPFNPITAAIFYFFFTHSQKNTHIYHIHTQDIYRCMMCEHVRLDACVKRNDVVCCLDGCGMSDGGIRGRMSNS